MRWIGALERKIGRFAIKQLMVVITSLNLAVFLLYLAGQSNIISKLTLVPDLVLKGEVWRLITYIFIPPSFSFIWIIFVLYFYYMIGTNLEREWGSFKFNIFYFLGMIGTTIACFITGGEGTPIFLNLSLFLAFAKLYPDFELLIFFILPVKIKYLAWLNFVFIGITVLAGDMNAKVAALVSLLNYFIFFGSDIFKSMKLRTQVNRNRRRFFQEIREAERKRQ